MKPLETVLTARQLGFTYDTREIFKNVSFTVGQGEILCLIGTSGCGKSTLLRVLAGLNEPDKGEISGIEKNTRTRIAQGSVVFQSPVLLPWLTVAENVGFGLNFACRAPEPKASQQARITAVLEQVELTGCRDQYPSALSGGMAQRVALARALVRDPAIIYLDEPFSALDAITRESMQDLLIDLVHQHHAAALLVTHDLDEALRIGDRILLLAGRPAQIAGEWRPEGKGPRQHRSVALNAMREEILYALSGCTPAGSPVV